MYTKALSAGGHDMPANTGNDNVITQIAAADNTNDKVSSLYGIQQWSDVREVVYCVTKGEAATSPIGTTGIGDWDDETDYEGWMEIAELYGISDTEYEIKIIFDPEEFTGPIPVLGGWKIEDEATISDGQGGTMNGGLLCIKFANEISAVDVDNVTIGVKIIKDRTAVSYVTVHPAPTP